MWNTTVDKREFELWKLDVTWLTYVRNNLSNQLIQTRKYFPFYIGAEQHKYIQLILRKTTGPDSLK